MLQGDFSCETVYANDPVAVAQRWAELGAPRLHIVDLDGARLGRPQNLQTVRRIVERVQIPCQLGGGLRSESDLRAALDCGVCWCILGTQAFGAVDWFRDMCETFPGRLWLGVDVKDGMVATHGWQNTLRVTPEVVLEQFGDWPIAGFIVTDIRRDGTLSGVDAEWLGQLTRWTSLPVLASGGISSLTDITRIKEAGLAGCIVGKALYEGRIDLREALSLANGPIS